MKNWQSILVGFLFCLLVIGLLLLFFLPQRGSPIALVTRTPAPADSYTPTPAAIQVHITGNVINPGVYQLFEGARLNDAILAAGGLLDGADPSALNLSALLQDGQRVYIPLDPEPQLTLEPGTRGNLNISPGLININSATPDELMTLPGIGETKAKAIVEYRSSHGLYLSLEDILQVTGIGPSLYAQIESLITLGP